MPNSAIKNTTSNLAIYYVGVDGAPFGSCVKTGPFADFNVILNPGPPPANMSITAGPGRCLKRNFNVALANAAFQWKKVVEVQLALTPFANFTAMLDMDVANTGAVNGLHGCGHVGVGGEVRAIYPLLLGYFIHIL
jgi:Common central domain of tyrosinase